MGIEPRIFNYPIPSITLPFQAGTYFSGSALLIMFYVCADEYLERRYLGDDVT